MSLQVTLDELIAKSGDSELSRYSFLNGQLKLVLEMEEFDATATITILTQVLRVGTKLDLSEHQTSFFQTCRLELIELADVARIENGFYVPNPGFWQMMKEIRRGIGLAYGERADQMRLLFNVTGYNNLVSCLVRQRTDISWLFEQ
ncbi:MAG: hypothetical protein DYG89_53040 [Caldilinea sp. CFX5]|nr:hypothetical protein [Caldilinea sp. CFX5]